MCKYLLIVLCFTFCFCHSNTSSLKQESTRTDSSVSTSSSSATVVAENYTFEEPTETWILDPQLSEISGLTYESTTNRLLAINDEEGIIFALDPQNKGKIIQSYSFAKKGDYEGIAQVEQTTVVLKNNGQLYFFSPPTGDSQQVKTVLSAKNDVEGLAYDRQQNALLLACKGQALKTISQNKTEKAIYAYLLKEKKLAKQAFLTITDDDLLALLLPNATHYSKSKFKALKKRVRAFSPSGIAIHPQNRTFYILSARGSTLLKISYNKKLQQLFFLNENTIPQPEGICFDHNNNLYISTEGKGLYGKIFKFSL